MVGRMSNVPHHIEMANLAAARTGAKSLVFPHEFIDLLNDEARKVYENPIREESLTVHEHDGTRRELCAMPLGIEAPVDPVTEHVVEPAMKFLARAFERAVDEGLVGWGMHRQATQIGLGNHRAWLLIYPMRTADVTATQINEATEADAAFDIGGLPTTWTSPFPASAQVQTPNGPSANDRDEAAPAGPSESAPATLRESALHRLL